GEMNKIVTDCAPEVALAIKNADRLIRSVMIVDGGTSTIDAEANIIDTLEDVLISYNADITIKNISIQKSFMHTKKVKVEDVDLRRILENLIKNAIEATPHGKKIWINTNQTDLKNYSTIKVCIGNEGFV